MGHLDLVHGMAPPVHWINFLYGVITSCDSLLVYFIRYVYAIADGPALPTTVLFFVRSSADVRLVLQ